MNKKQTAVEWLYEQMFLSPKSIIEYQNILEQAKSMEKEQIQEAFKQGYECNEVDWVFEINETMFTAKEYYNKTYGE